jgi:hypothetical protein
MSSPSGGSETTKSAQSSHKVYNLAHKHFTGHTKAKKENDNVCMSIHVQGFMLNSFRMYVTVTSGWLDTSLLSAVYCFRQ